MATVTWYRLARPSPGWVLLLLALAAWQVYEIACRPAGFGPLPTTDTRWVGEVAGGQDLQQSFPIYFDRFSGVRLHARPAATRVSGNVVFELALTEYLGDHVLAKRVVPASDVVAHASFLVDFPGLSAPKGRLYRLRVSLPQTPFGEGILLKATRSEGFPEGYLRLQGREIWGDLVMALETPHATLLDHATFLTRLSVRPWSRALVCAGLLLLHVPVVLLLWCAGEEGEPCPDAVPRGASTAGGRAAAWKRAVAVLIVAGVWASPFAASWRDLLATADLIERFPEATLRTTMPNLRRGFAIVEAPEGVPARRCLLALPFSRIVWSLDVPPGARLTSKVLMRPDTWEGPGDGAVFRVGVSDGASYEERFRVSLDPKDRPEDRRVVPVSINLSAYAGRRIDVIFNTEPGAMGHAVGDAALWCDPRIVQVR